MIRLSRTDNIDLYRYEQEINRLGYILLDDEKFKLAVKNMRNSANTLYERSYFKMRLHSGCRVATLDSKGVYRLLTEYMHCPDHYFHTGKTKNASLDVKRVLSKLIANGYGVDFLEDYCLYKSEYAKANKLQSLLNSVIPVECTRDGNKVCKINIEANEQKNLRFNYKNPDIISMIPKKHADCICAEDGYFLAWGDFAQSDFRIAYNLFIRSPENDKIFNKYDDKYEALARIVDGDLFDAEKFVEERKVYKVMTLATIYGTRDSCVPEEQQFIKKFSDFLMNRCPRYREFWNRLQQNLKSEEDIVLESYFGHEQNIYVSTSNLDHSRNDALNSPIQTGTSEVVVAVVNTILDKVRELGYDEDQFSLYLTRHDEPVFRIREDAKDALWVLNECSEILVDEWSPLKMEYDFGYHYNVPDEALKKEYERVCAEHPATILELQEGETTFYPLKDLTILHCIWGKTADGNQVVTWYGDDKVLYSLLPADVDPVDDVRARLAKSKLVGVDKNVLVLTQDYAGIDYIDDTKITWKRKPGDIMFCMQLCAEMIVLYNYRKGLGGKDIKLRDIPVYEELKVDE